MSAALDKKLRRKANRQLRKLGEREVTAQAQRQAQGKINMLQECNRIIDGDFTLSEKAGARKAKKATTVRWEKRNTTNVKEWFNPTGKQFVR